MEPIGKREEQIMQILWQLKKALIKEIRTQFPDPKPHYNTIATLIKNLERKKFVKHESVGNVHLYFPVITKDAYQKREIGTLISNYFNNSYKNLVTYFAEEENISEEELEEILKMIKQNKS